MSKNIAHRGASGNYPENTMLAFEKAVEIGCDGIETDIQLTKDNIPVICHDELVDRTTNGEGLLREYNYKELMKLDAGIKKSMNFSGLKIPTLEELLDFVRDKNLYINLELKNSIIEYEGIEEMVINKIYEYKIENNVILSSFNHNSMVKCKSIDSYIKTGLLYEGCIYNPVKYAFSTKADALHPDFHSLKSKIIKEIMGGGCEINTYTVNDKKYMKWLIEMGVDGIITNYPELLKEVKNNKIS